MPRPILLCTVGTSLFGNLNGLRKTLDGGLPVKDELRPLAEAHRANDLDAVAVELSKLPGSERTCGAEINSLASMIEHQYAEPHCGLYFFHSATEDGRRIARILVAYYRRAGHSPVEAVEVADLQDSNPRLFRTHGLRNLVRGLARVIRDHGAAQCAINATGGYKAQIALAVLIGQALAVPVYYKHELFSEIIAFPPLPVALDFEVWMQASGLLFDLARSGEGVPYADYADDWDERYESLVERVTIDGVERLDLAPTGAIFHETFRDRFRSQRDLVLPPDARPEQKKEPTIRKDEAHLLAHPEFRRFLEDVTREVGPVTLCISNYYNPVLPARTRFVYRDQIAQGIFSPGGWTARFRVESTATTEGQQRALVARLNEWLEQRR